MSRLYTDASRVLAKFLSTSRNNRGSLKSHLYGNDTSSNRAKGKMYALVAETVRHLAVIRRVLEICPVHGIDNEALLYLVLYDFLLGRGVSGGGKVKRAITAVGDNLKKALKRVQEEAGETLVVPRAASLPRYVRVNTIKVAVDEAIEALQMHKPAIDLHIPYILKLDNEKNLYENPLVKSCAVILQDKSSCFPAHALVETMKYMLPSGNQRIDVIDACAAPGNKTSHLAAFANHSGINNRVFAYDKDEKRAGILKRRIAAAGCDGLVSASCDDFLETNPADPAFEHVRGVLLDPTCSGSGITGRLRRFEADTDDRLEKLAEFQSLCIDHAFSFPQVDVVSYSTCSIHVAENERVVARALARNSDFVLAPMSCVLPTWERRGVACEGLTHEESMCCLRADAAHDDTNGFFVAVFVRKKCASSANKSRKMKARRKKRRRGKKRKLSSVT